MQTVETMTAKQLYRGILKAVKIYPSKNRDMMRVAIIEDIADWKKVEGQDERNKAIKKMRMLYGHLIMWNTKMEEVHNDENEKVDKPLPFKDMN
jgi:hypothetical protein